VTPAQAERWVEGLELLGMRFGLERMRALLAVLGHPERAWPAVHVVGSNGKSSTTRLTALALRSQGLRAGAYLSPHVSGWRERVEVDGRAVPGARFAWALTRVREAGEGLVAGHGERVTQFEALTAAAFCLFADREVDVAVVEAGLGGRYDATNVLRNAVVALTNVSLEHTDLLGSTERAIAAEKLAVAPRGSRRVLVGRLSAEAASAVAAELSARRLRAWRHPAQIGSGADEEGRVWVRTPSGVLPGLPLPLAGRFQRDNLMLAVAAAEMRLGRPLARAPLVAALRRARMPGRLETLGGAPLIVLDGAHNPAGMRALAESLPDVVGRRRPVAVLSVLGDKDAAAMVGELSSRVRAVVATRSGHSRAVDPDRLRALAAGRGLPAEAVADPVQALGRARRIAGARGAVLVCGSLYLLADLREAAGNAVRERGAGMLARA
jgi:dihydrofolate synthase/folylpolyglutamate synthase